MVLKLFSTTEHYQSIYFEVRVTGFYKVKEALTMLSYKGFYRGLLRDSLTSMLRGLRDYAKMITHVQTGALAGAHRYEYDSHSMRGWLYIDPRVVYAQGSTLRWPREYGVYEHARGGSHAFYQRTMNEEGYNVATRGMKLMVRVLDLRLPPSD